MTKLIAQNVVDEEMRDWIMPKFTTTTETDRVVASILMMGALQKYFSYGMRLTCGLPSVTLLGVRADWQEILLRLEKLPRLGTEAAQFYDLLKPVLTRFVDTFDKPDSDDIKDFWSKIAHEAHGSGTHLISGWITAFCFWDAKGMSLYSKRGTELVAPVSFGAYRRNSAGLCLDGALYHRVDMRYIPVGYASVPVKVDDNGVLHETIMVAGSVGIRAWSSGQTLEQPESGYRVSDRNAQEQSSGTDTLTVGLDSIQPLSGWWMFRKLDEKAPDSCIDAPLGPLHPKPSFQYEERSHGSQDHYPIDIYCIRRESQGSALQLVILEPF